jgi:hypothetical protein
LHWHSGRIRKLRAVFYFQDPQRLRTSFNLMPLYCIIWSYGQVKVASLSICYRFSSRVVLLFIRSLTPVTSRFLERFRVWSILSLLDKSRSVQMTQFLDVLEANPHLTELKISSAGPRSWDEMVDICILGCLVC